MKKILVTGANGFVGQVFCVDLHLHGYNVLAVVRSENVLVEILSALL